MLKQQENLGSFNNRGVWPFLIALVFFLIIYLLFATHFFGHIKMSIPRNGIGTYDALAQAILAGHFDVKFSTSDPRLGPVLSDLSQFNGKFYLYWGIAPVILLYVPFRALFGCGLPDVVPVYLFMIGSYVFAAIIILKVRNRFYQSVSNAHMLCAFAVVGMGNIACYMIKQARVYEVAYASGHFLFMGGVLGIVLWLMGGKLQSKYLMFSSLSFGLCVLCQQQYELTIMVILLILGYGIYASDEDKRFQLMSLFLPALICVFGAAFYNYIRFGDLLETGYSYQRNNLPFLKLTLAALPKNVYLQIFQPPIFSSHFPYLISRGNDALSSWLSFKLRGYNTNEVSLFYLSPYILVLLFPFQKAGIHINKLVDSFLKFKRSGLSGLTGIQTIKAVAVLAYIFNFLVVLLFPYNDFRYELVYSTPVYLVATFIWFDLLTICSDSFNTVKKKLFNPSLWIFILAIVSFLENLRASFFR